MNFIVEIVITWWYNKKEVVEYGGGCTDGTVSKG